MLFSSLFFIMVFAPVVVLIQYLLRGKFQNWWLLIASYFFYAWGDIRFVPVMAAASLVVYLYGAMHSKVANKSKLNTTLFWLTQLLLFSPLLFYKYFVFVLTNLQQFLDFQINLPEITLPLGISFFTFQACSYAADVYRGKYKGEKYPLPVFLYIALYIFIINKLPITVVSNHLLVQLK